MVFKELWAWLASAEDVPMPDRVREVFFCALCLQPLMFSEMRERLSPEVSATDAPMAGGGVCRSLGLTRSGFRELERRRSLESSTSSDEVVMIGFVDGIAAPRMA